MSLLEQIYDWEKLGYAGIIYIMIKWLGFDSVETTVSRRLDVESTVWISLKIKSGNGTWYISGQRNDIIQKRLIEFLDKLGHREQYLAERNNSKE